MTHFQGNDITAASQCQCIQGMAPLLEISDDATRFGVV